MSRWEFMRRLEELLSDISPNEREEALQYYNDYFNDAGRENEQSVIDALGSPEQVARIVKDGLSENSSHGAFTENGFTNGPVEETTNALIKKDGNQGNAAGDQKASGFGAAKSTVGNGKGNTGSTAENGKGAAGGSREDQGYQKNSSILVNPEKEKKEALPAWEIVLIVIVCIAVSPVIIGIAGSVFGAIVGLACAILGVTVGLGAAAVILFIVAAALAAAGFGNLFTAPFSAAGLIGGGCICAAIGILFMLAAVFMAGKCIPAICKGIAYIFKSIFKKKEEETV